MHYPFKIGYLGSSPSGVTVLFTKKKTMLRNKKKKEFLKEKKTFTFTVVSTFNREVLK